MTRQAFRRAALITTTNYPLIHQDLLQMAEKPLEEQEAGAQNGLKVVEMDTEVETGTEAEDQLTPPAGEPLQEPVTSPSSMDLQVPLKEDPAQGSQSDSHLSSQDLRRAKRIRVRPAAV